MSGTSIIAQFSMPLRSSRTEYDSATNPNICQFVAIRGIRGQCTVLQCVLTILLDFQYLQEGIKFSKWSPPLTHKLIKLYNAITFLYDIRFWSNFH